MSRHGRNKIPKLVIGVPKAFGTELKLNGADRFVLQTGTGAQAGKLRIMRNANGVKPTKVRAGALVFHFGYVPMLGDDAAEKEFVIVKQVENGFELDAPAWFKAETQ